MADTISDLLQRVDTLEKAVADLHQLQRILVSAKVQSLSLKEGDIVLFKMGDPSTGWFPTVEAAERFEALVKEAFKVVKLQTVAIVYNYAVEPVVFTPIKKEDSMKPREA